VARSLQDSIRSRWPGPGRRLRNFSTRRMSSRFALLEPAVDELAPVADGHGGGVDRPGDALLLGPLALGLHDHGEQSFSGDGVRDDNHAVGRSPLGRGMDRRAAPCSPCVA
jgi:hypothetical protein